MKDKEIRGWLEAIRDNLALMNLEPSPLGKSTLAQVNELLRLLKANPPLAEVEGWVASGDAKQYRDDNRMFPRLSRCRYYKGDIPVTVTIRERDV